MRRLRASLGRGIPAYAGMTVERGGMTARGAQGQGGAGLQGCAAVASRRGYNLGEVGRE